MSSTRRGPAVLLVLVGLVVVIVALAIWALRDDGPGAAPPRAGTAEAPRAPKRPPADRRPKAVRPVVETKAPETVEPAPAPVAPKGPPGVLQQVVQVHVIVHRSGGGPASGALVLAIDPLGRYLTTPGPDVRATRTADADGKAEIEIAGGTTVLRILAALEGEAALSDGVDLAATGGAAAERTVELTLAPAPSLRVHVAATDDTPIAGATVQATYVVSDAETWPVRLQQTADADGAATFPGVPLGWRSVVLVRAGAHGFVPAEQTLRTRTIAAGPIEFRLERGATVSGRAVDEQGQPIANALARIVDGPRGDASGADGRFEVAGLPPRGGALFVSAAEFAPVLVRDLRGDMGDVTVGDVVLHPGGRVAGVVFGIDGAPVAGAQVRVVEQETGTEIDVAKTGDDGRFAFDHMPDGPLTVEAAEARGATDWAAGRKASATDVRPGGGDVRIELTGAASVYVRFLNDADRTPVVVSSVRLTATAVGDTPEASAWAWSGANISAIRFQPDHTGVFDVEIEVPGWDVGVAKAVEVAPDREMRIDVLFRRRAQ